MFNANNYGYNPYGRYIPQQSVQNQMQPLQQMQPVQPIEQPLSIRQKSVLNGKSVDSVEVVKATDIPLDGSISYFPLTDGSAIVTKQLQMDGTSKIVVYKPFEETKKELPVYVTLEDLKKEIEKIDFSDIDDLKDEMRDLKQQLKDLKKKKVKDE